MATTTMQSCLQDFKAAHVKVLLWWLAVESQSAADAAPEEPSKMFVAMFLLHTDRIQLAFFP